MGPALREGLKPGPGPSSTFKARPITSCHRQGIFLDKSVSTIEKRTIYGGRGHAEDYKRILGRGRVYQEMYQTVIAHFCLNFGLDLDLFAQ